MTQASRLAGLWLSCFFLGACEVEGLLVTGDAGDRGGANRGPAVADGRAVSVPDAGGADGSVGGEVGIDGEIYDVGPILVDLSPDGQVSAEVDVDVGVVARSEVGSESGREASVSEAGPDLLVLADLRSMLPEAGPETKRCSAECLVGCNVGCGPSGQCLACATCTCEVASGTCHC